MDYRELLKKYIGHVLDAEGVTFISQGHHYTQNIFNDAEWAELLRLESEINTALDEEDPPR